jgi:hypothetical protein
MAPPLSPYANLSSWVLANPEKYCTVSTCPLSLAYIQYLPSFAGNTFYASLFVLFLVGQLFVGIRYSTWGFSGGMVVGILLEIVGYLARVQMYYNPFLKGPFLM